MKNKRAFTLVEVLLAVSLFSIVAVTSYSIFWSGMRIGHQTETSKNLYRQAYWSLELMTKELENAVSYDFSASYPDKQAFVGTKGNISFLIEGEDGLKVVRYYLLAEDEGEVHQTIVHYQAYKENVQVTQYINEEEPEFLLIREEVSFRDYLAGHITDHQVNMEILALGVKEEGLIFSYGVKDDTLSGQYSWYDQWAEAKLPAGISINIRFKDMDGGDKGRSFGREVFIPSQAGGYT